MMIILLIVIVQLLSWFSFVTITNKYACHTYYGKKYYIIRFFQILGYIVNLIPGSIIIDLFVLIIACDILDYSKLSDLFKNYKWYKWLFTSPYE